MIRFILTIIFVVMFLVCSIPLFFIEWIIGKISPNAKSRSSLAIVNWAFRVVILIAGTKVLAVGEENVPKDTPVLYVANHRSYFDILLLHTTSGKRPGFVAKAEMDKFLLLNWWMRNINCLFLDRQDMRSGVQMIKDGAELIKKGHSMVICPEGTRNQQHEMLPFKEGSLKMADKADCPVVPVAIIDSDQMLEIRPGFHIKSGSPKVIYGKPFYIKDLDKDNRKHAGAYVQEIIRDMIEAHGGQTA